MNDPRVALVSCASYDDTLVYERMAAALDLCGCPELRGKRVLVKPNLLMAYPLANAVTTHPAVVRAALRHLQARGATCVLGDSPAIASTAAVARKTGVAAVCEELGVPVVEFDDAIEMDNPAGARVRRFRVAKILSEVDLVVNLPKLKTHGQMYYTGAIKNLFGLVPGLGKSQFHLRFPDRALFAAMIVDLALLVKPALSIMDAVVSMEGAGPRGGDPRATGWLIASQNALALDWTACRLIGYDPQAIPILREALGRGAWLTDPARIEVRGERVEDLALDDFQLVTVLKDMGFIGRLLPKPLFELVKRLAVPRPVFDHTKCIRCGECVRICAAQALTFEDHRSGTRRIAIDPARCIRCYCCHEICPADAIKLKRRV